MNKKAVTYSSYPSPGDYQANKLLIHVPLPVTVVSSTFGLRKNITQFQGNRVSRLRLAYYTPLCFRILINIIESQQI